MSEVVSKCKSIFTSLSLYVVMLTRYQYAVATKKPPPTMLPMVVGIMDFQM